MDISIVIITHNNLRLLLPCLDSLKASFTDSKFSYEVIVVQNACSDETEQILKNKYPWVKTFINPLNEGFSRANNHGIKMTTGDYVVLLNDDTLVMPEVFQKMARFFETNPKIGAVGPKLLNPDMSLQTAGAKHNKLLYTGTKPVKRSFLGFAAIMFRRSMMNEIGLLDENYFFYNEELDYLTRVRRAGFECWYLPEAEIVHFGGQTTKAKRLDFELEGIQGTFYFLGKFYPELYPAYRVLYGAFAILVFLFSPVLILRQRGWEERKKYLDFYHRMLLLALGWSRKKYVPRQFF